MRNSRILLRFSKVIICTEANLGETSGFFVRKVKHLSGAGGSFFYTLSWEAHSREEQGLQAGLPRGLMPRATGVVMVPGVLRVIYWKRVLG